MPWIFGLGSLLVMSLVGCGTTPAEPAVAASVAEPAEVVPSEVHQPEVARPEPGPPWRASHILIRWADDPAAARATATRLLADLDGGTPIADLARAWSHDPSGPRGGALGVFGAGVYDPAFEAGVAALPVGGAGLVEANDGVHVVVREAVDVGAYAHLVVCWAGARACRASRSEAEARARMDQATAELTGGAAFADVARTWSDSETAADGGALGAVGPETLPTALWRAAAELRPGETSDVVALASGLHLIHRAQ